MQIVPCCRRLLLLQWQSQTLSLLPLFLSQALAFFASTLSPAIGLFVAFVLAVLSYHVGIRVQSLLITFIPIGPFLALPLCTSSQCSLRVFSLLVYDTMLRFLYQERNEVARLHLLGCSSPC